MSSALEKFSDPGHTLILKEDITQAGAKCHVCAKSVLGQPAYTCSKTHNDACRNFYLHNTCAKLPTHIKHHKHNQHSLTLDNRPDTCSCDVCSRPVRVAYACYDCDFDVCVFCTCAMRMLHHEAHNQHELILMNRRAVVECDACGAVAKDSTYVCTTCEFWIHKKCAYADSIIQSPSCHHHPLRLIYSIPERHRDIAPDCSICDKVVYNSNWMYYCHQCTYFVHMNCATSSVSKEDEDESDDLSDALKDLRDEITGNLEEELEAEAINMLPDSVQFLAESSPVDLLGSLVSALL
ncbi:protein VACUOLELESS GAMETOPHYTES-like [Apium graveolens]|uniref:protein VACUOLELESS GAMETOPHYTES-like n=1 Tax=Apium graveolens TaxID=4045 RepID=UPI003D78C91F